MKVVLRGLASAGGGRPAGGHGLCPSAVESARLCAGLRRRLGGLAAGPHGRQQETARTGFQRALPTLWAALIVTALLAYLLAAAD